MYLIKLRRLTKHTGRWGAVRLLKYFPRFNYFLLPLVPSVQCSQTESTPAPAPVTPTVSHLCLTKMMNIKFAVMVILIPVLTVGCGSSASQTATPTLIGIIPTHTLYPTSTFTSVPTSTPQPLADQSKLISKGNLNCSPLGTFTKCVDDVLNIEFEYPTIWGEIEAVLRTGGYTGYAYTYYFGGKTIAETEPLVAGGRSRDFSEGRG
jgi:hypothetical protein